MAQRHLGKLMHRYTVLLGVILALGFCPQSEALPSLMNNVRVERVTTKEEIPPTTGGNIYVLDPELPAGKLQALAGGTAGYVERVFSRIYIEGRLADEELISETRVDPTPAGMRISAKGFPSPFPQLNLNRVITMESTAYTPDAGLGSRATFRTRTGRRAEFGVVAVDPNVIPLNTLVFVEGYGLALAADTGGAIRGNKIDVCVQEYRTARIWGRRSVRVHVFRETVGEPWRP